MAETIPTDIETGLNQTTDLIRYVIEHFEEPQGGEKNIMHFVFADGTVTARCVPWISKEGKDLADAPEWVSAYQTALTKKADFLMRLDDPAEQEGGYSAGARNFRNPVTGEIVRKMAPWYDDGNSLILEEFVPGLLVSDGRQISYKHNPEQQFDDPSDPNNFRFLCYANTRRAALNAFSKAKPPRDGQPYVPLEGSTSIVGANMGGTIMMAKGEGGGLEPSGEIGRVFDKHFQNTFPTCFVASFALPPMRNRKEDKASYGIDSSQMEIEFMADVAIAMTTTWNEYFPEERRAFGGFIVSLGSDTCAYDLSLLKMMLGPNCPFSVIGVVSIKPFGEEGSEGPNSFLKAIEELETLKNNRLTTVGLRAEGGLYEPTRSRKMKDSEADESFVGKKIIDTNAFEKIADHKDRFYAVKDEDYEKPYIGTLVLRGESRVKTISSEVSKDPFELEEEISRSNADVILVEAYASLTQAMNMQRAILRGAKGRPVFYVNSVLGGAIDHLYGPARALAEEGLAFPIGLTSHAAKAKLEYAVRLFGKDKQKIIDFMTKNNFVGEQPDGFSPYSVHHEQEAERLKQRLYEVRGIDEDALRLFESDEADVHFAAAEIRSALSIAMSDQDTVVAENLKRQFAFYKLVCALELQQVIDLIMGNEDIRTALASDDEDGLVARIISAGTISEVELQGRPIELELVYDQAA